MEPVLPLNCGSPSALAPQPRDWDLLLTAETHNFPCAVAPYPGAPAPRSSLSGNSLACAVLLVDAASETHRAQPSLRSCQYMHTHRVDGARVCVRTCVSTAL